MKRICFFSTLFFTLICFSCVNINDLISVGIGTQPEKLTLEEFLAEETQDINATATITNNTNEEVSLKLYYIYDNKDGDLIQTITLARNETKNLEITKNKIKFSAKYLNDYGVLTEDISIVKLKGNCNVLIDSSMEITGQSYIVSHSFIL